MPSTATLATALPEMVPNKLEATTATFAGPTIFPYWDDLYTTDAAGGQGIFTDLSGVVGSRVFVIEWRTQFC